MDHLLNGLGHDPLLNVPVNCNLIKSFIGLVVRRKCFNWNGGPRHSPFNRCHHPKNSILSSHRSRILSSHRLSNRILSSHRSQILSSHRPHNRILSSHRSHNSILSSDRPGFSNSLNSIGKTILSVNVFVCTIHSYQVIVPESLDRKSVV